MAEANDAGDRSGVSRQQVRFLVLFAAILVGGFVLLAWNPINDHVVVPFTAQIAHLSGDLLDLIGQDVSRDGTVIRSSRFAVNIENGCNGVETMLIFLAATAAFPTSWRSRALGLLLGVAVIQAVNLVRIVGLFLTGAYLPTWFDASHTVIWQTIVVLSAVLLWLFWVSRLVPRPEPADG